MNPREKTLAAIVGAMVLTMGLLYAVQLVRSQFNRRDDRLQTLREDLDQQQRIVRQGDAAARQIEQYQARALPEDRTQARRGYESWLLTEAVKAGFRGVNVSPLFGKANGDIYYQHTFFVSGQADLRQLTTFLHTLHGSGYLHRVTRLSAKPLASAKDLDVSVTVEALSLPGASNRDSLGDPPGVPLAQGELDKYLETIVSRNLFGPANKPPELTSTGPQTGYPGRPLRFQIRGRDPDKEDRLSYSLDESTLDGARLDSKSGEFEWTPEKLGEYEVAVRVTDNGFPPKSQSGKVKIAVVEPPPPPEPPKPGFDPASQSIVTGITQTGGRRELWVTVRTEGRVLRLREGDEIAVGSVKGVVSRIDASGAEIKTGEGGVLTVALGKSLLASAAPGTGGI